VADFFKWLIMGWSIVVVWYPPPWGPPDCQIRELKKIETDDITLCYIIAFFCWINTIAAFSILARALGF